ncbi:MAG: menaquinone biosynthetic enzyme MqnA/MqnD family protein [Betaproteobacteria bacterium]
MSRASRVRVGAVGYLNARPLVYGLDRDPRFEVRFDLPSRCAALLHEQATDVGLIPSIEYLRGDYRIVPGLAIASSGAVKSVALFTTRPMSDVRSIALDTSSRASVALTRVLCARLFRIAPAFEPLGPDLGAMLARADAALIIGDRALFIDGGIRVQADPDTPERTVCVEKIDLGEAWLRMTGLPFVYAFWAGRPHALSDDHVQALQRTRDLGVARPDEIAASYYPDDAARQAVAARYLRDNIKYYLGDDERAALDLFYRYAAEAGVVPAAAPLRFY